MVLGFLIVLALIGNYLHNKKAPKKIGVPPVPVLEYNYKMFRKHLYKIACEIAVPLSLTIPKLPSNLDAPIRWSIFGECAVLYHYILLTNGEEIDTDIIHQTIQLSVSQKLENGAIDGKEASSIIVDGVALPRIMVHSVEVTKNMCEISIVFVNEEYAKSYKSNFTGDLDSALDIRDIEEDI